MATNFWDILLKSNLFQQIYENTLKMIIFRQNFEIWLLIILKGWKPIIHNMLMKMGYYEGSLLWHSDTGHPMFWVLSKGSDFKYLKDSFFTKEQSLSFCKSGYPVKLDQCL